VIFIDTNKFIFHVCTFPDEPDLIVVTINTKECWNNYHYLTDSYTKEEWDILNPESAKLSLVSLADSSFESMIDRDIPTLVKLLISKGLEQDSEFSNWMEI